MKWPTHVEITDKATEGLLNIENRAKLCRYNLETDKYVICGDVEHPVSHHRCSDDEVMKWVDYAREDMYRGNHDEFLKYLGYALHLIQDKCVKLSIIRYREERLANTKIDKDISDDEVRRQILRTNEVRVCGDMGET